MRERITVDKEVLRRAIEDVSDKLRWRLSQKGWEGYIGPHETLGIVAEEYDELKDAVRSNVEGDVEKELMDVAVGCIFGIASLRTNREARNGG